MIAVIILVLSILALIQFFVSYCRSLLTAYGEVEISHDVRQLADCDDRPLRSADFGRIVRLLQLSPEKVDDRAELRAVRAYYAIVRLLGAARGLASGLGGWAEGEQMACVHFAAVALDRRIPSPSTAAQ